MKCSSSKLSSCVSTYTVRYPDSSNTHPEKHRAVSVLFRVSLSVSLSECRLVLRKGVSFPNASPHLTKRCVLIKTGGRGFAAHAPRNQAAPIMLRTPPSPYGGPFLEVPARKTIMLLFMETAEYQSLYRSVSTQSRSPSTAGPASSACVAVSSSLASCTHSTACWPPDVGVQDPRKDICEMQKGMDSGGSLVSIL